MKAIILAGGMGTRLKPITELIPKPLIQVGNKTCIEWVLDNLRSHGITDITQYIDYHPDGTQGALKSLLPYWTEPTIVCNGDTISNVNVTEMLKMWENSKVQAIIFNPQDDITHNGGTYIFNKDVLDKMTSGDLPDLLNKLDNYQIYTSDAYFYDIGTVDRLTEARKVFA